MGRLQVRSPFPTPEELRATAIHFLKEGNEQEEARILASCCLELGEVRVIDGGARQIDITIRCKRKELEELQPLEPGTGSASKLMDHIRRAVSVALPSGVHLGYMDARAGGPGMLLPGNSDPPPAIRQEAPPPSTALESRTVPERGTGWAFRRMGDSWSVAFNGGPAFYIEDSLGARYIDYLLHHPGEPISAYELEHEVRPERQYARPRDSIQREQDPAAVKNYLRELGRVRGQIEAAQAAGNLVEQQQLETELASLEAQLEGRACAADAGERARNNVRKAIGVLTSKLRKGEKAQRAFAEHVRVHVNLGYKCFYNQPTSQAWA